MNSNPANCLSSNIFKVFPNIRQITISTTRNHPFNLFLFLENISSSSKWRKIVIIDFVIDEEDRNQYWDEVGGWIANYWNCVSMQVIEAYRKKGLIIKFMKGSGEQGTLDLYERLTVTRM